MLTFNYCKQTVDLIFVNKHFYFLLKMNKKYVNPKKILIRNVQVPLTNENTKVKVVKCTSNRNDIQGPVTAARPSNTRRTINVDEVQTLNDKYCKPELNTCLGLVKKMKDIKQMKIKPIDTEGDLTPRSKQIYRHEFTKVLNLPVDKKIFHHLIPLNVNDSMIIETKEKTKHKACLPGKHIDLEPQLEDFLTPIEPITMIFPMSEKLDVIPKTNTRVYFDYLQNMYATFGPNL